jgi:hypothetical protein
MYDESPVRQPIFADPVGPGIAVIELAMRKDVRVLAVKCERAASTDLQIIDTAAEKLVYRLTLSGLILPAAINEGIAITLCAEDRKGSSFSLRLIAEIR